MANGIYIGMAGAAARADQLEAVADNLANAQTPGFRAARPTFESLLVREGGPDAVFPVTVSGGLDTRPGATTRTGNNLDLALEGDLMLGVEGPAGEPQYTRAGRLSVDASGQLLAVGRPLLDAGGAPIRLPPDTVPDIGNDGVVRANNVEIARIGLFRVEGPLTRVGPQLLAPAANARAEAVAGRVRLGELELGNASPLETAVALIGAQRAFDSSMQAIETYRRISDRAIEVGRVR